MGVLGSLSIVLGVSGDLWGQTSASPVEILECVDWDLEEKDPEIFPYVSKASAPVYFDFHRTDIGSVTRLTPYFNRDMECRDKPALDMFLKKNTLSLDHPLFARGTGPIIEFEKGKDYRDGIIDLLDLIHEHHFLKLPGQKKIAIRKSVFNKHDSFEFPLGAALIHKVTLRAQAPRPLEMRFLVKDSSGWFPVIYLPENDALFKNRVCAPGQFRRFFANVVRSHDFNEKGYLPGHEGSVRKENVSKSIRDLGWFESEKYGRMRLTYPVVGVAHCIECHSELGSVQRVDLRRPHQFVRESDFTQFQGRSFYSLNERIRRLEAEIDLTRARWKALTELASKNDPEERKKKKKVEGAKPNRKVCGPDFRTGIDPAKYQEEVRKLILGSPLYSYEKQQQQALELAERERDNNTDVSPDWEMRLPGPKPQFPKTIQGRADEAEWYFNRLGEEKSILSSLYGVPTKEIGKKNKNLERHQSLGPCGFVDLADQMPFNADLIGYTRSYQRKFGTKPFEALNPRECKLTEIRVGERVTMTTPVIPLSKKSQGAHGPRSEQSLLSLVVPETETPLEFVVTEKTSEGVLYGRLVDRDLSPADRETQVILSQLKSGDIAFELRFKDGRDRDHADNFYVSYEGVIPPTLKYLSCLDSEPITPHEGRHVGHSMARMNRDMANPFRFGRGTNFFNIHLIHSAFGIASRGAAAGNQTASTGHVMGSVGRRFDMLDGRFVLRAEYLFSPDRWLVPERGILSPLTYGDPMKRGGTYKGAQHPHNWLGVLQGGGCFLWGSDAYTCLSAGLIGDVTAGINYMRQSNQNLVVKEGGPHHALEVFHAFQRNPVQVKTVIGPWRFDFSAFSGSEPNLWSNDFALKRLDSFAGRIQRDWKGQTFGASYAHVNARHPEQTVEGDRDHGAPAVGSSAQSPHGVLETDPHGEKDANLERTFNAWHEGSYLFYHRKLKEIQWDMTNAMAFQRRAVETPAQLLTFLSEHMLTFANKQGLTLRFDMRQVPLSDAVEVKVTDPHSGAQWVRNYTVGYFRTLRDRMKTTGYRVDFMANYTRTSALPRGLGLPGQYENPSHTFAAGLRFQFMKSLGRFYHGVNGH